LFVVAYGQAEEPVGCGGYRPHAQAGTVEVKKMYIRPAWRGLGTGRHLLRRFTMTRLMAMEPRLDQQVLDVIGRSAQSATWQQGSRMLGMHPPVSRLTVVGPRRRLDLVLPSTLSVAELMPELVRLGGGPAETGELRTWSLARPAGPDLAPSATLREAGVRDGDVLLLRHEHAPALGLLGYGAAEAVRQAVDRAEGVWTAGRRNAVLLVFAGLAVAGLAAALPAAAPELTAGIGAVAAMLLLGAARLAVADPPVARALAGLAALPAAAAGAGAGELAGTGTVAGVLTWAAGGVLGAAVGALAVGPAVRPVAVAGVLGGVAGMLAAGVADAAPPARVAATTAVLVVAALPMLPRLAVRITQSSLISAVELAEDDAAAATTAAHVQLAALLWAAVALLAAAGAVLAVEGGTAVRLLMGAVGLATLLRAGDYRFTAEVVPLAVGGLAVVGMLASSLALDLLERGDDLLAVAVPGALGVVAVLAVLPQLRGLLAARPWGRAIRWLDALVLAALPVLLLGVLGVYELVAEAASGS
jgi:type VII secretion integral membrane protein EccD